MEKDHPHDIERRPAEAAGTPPVIRTPDQRVRVFVSSTLDGLAPERAAAREAITQLRLTPVLFESGARPYPPRELYRAYLAQSDIFLGLYWQRYGWVAPGMQVSGLENEYQLSTGKPKLIYMKIREYAREQLAASGEEATMQERHAHYFLRLSEETKPHLFRPGWE